MLLRHNQVVQATHWSFTKWWWMNADASNSFSFWNRYQLNYVMQVNLFVYFNSSYHVSVIFLFWCGILSAIKIVSYSSLKLYLKVEIAWHFCALVGRCRLFFLKKESLEQAIYLVLHVKLLQSIYQGKDLSCQCFICLFLFLKCMHL